METHELSEPLKSIHVRVDPDLHSALKVMAEHDEVEISVLCERLLSKAVRGEFHALKVAAKRMARLGIVGDSQG